MGRATFATDFPSGKTTGGASLSFAPQIKRKRSASLINKGAKNVEEEEKKLDERPFVPMKVQDYGMYDPYE